MRELSEQQARDKMGKDMPQVWEAEVIRTNTPRPKMVDRAEDYKGIGAGDKEYQAAQDRYQATEKASKTAVTRGCLAYFPRAINEVAKVSMFGAKKHGFQLEDKGFLDPKYTDAMYEDAIGRHVMARFIEGERNAADGDLYHLAQLAWNTLARLERLLISAEADRPAQP